MTPSILVSAAEGTYHAAVGQTLSGSPRCPGSSRPDPRLGTSAAVAPPLLLTGRVSVYLGETTKDESGSVKKKKKNLLQTHS